MLAHPYAKSEKDWCSVLFIYIATEPSSSIQPKRIKCDLMFYPAFVRFSSYSHFNGAKLSFFSCMIHIIEYTMISSWVCDCVWCISGRRTRKKMYLENHFGKVWTTLNRINDPPLTNVFRSKFEFNAPKNSIMPLSFCCAHSFSFALNEVKMRNSIVHAKLWLQKKSKQVERKTEWENRWNRSVRACRCVSVCRWEKSWRK